MRRTMKLTFESDTDWATVLETLRRRPEMPASVDNVDIPAAVRGSRIAALCREFLDAPQAAKNGEVKS